MPENPNIDTLGDALPREQARCREPQSRRSDMANEKCRIHGTSLTGAGTCWLCVSENREPPMPPPAACPECERLKDALKKTSQEAWVEHQLQMARDGEVATLRKERDAALLSAQSARALLLKARRWIVAGHTFHDIAAAKGCDVCMVVAEIDAHLAEHGKENA